MGNSGVPDWPDLRAIVAFAEKFPGECGEGINEADAIRKSGELTAVDAIQQLDAAMKDFRAIPPFKKSFRDRLKKLPDPGSEIAPAGQGGGPAASAEVTAQLIRGPKPDMRSPLTDLRADLVAAESEVSDFYTGRLAEFDAYSRRSRSEPALAELIATVRRFEADTLYRMGRRRAARAIWNRQLRDDRLNPDLLHKLAVADTHDPDPGAGLASWRAYVEVLYFRDVVAGTPRPGRPPTGRSPPPARRSVRPTGAHSTPGPTTERAGPGPRYGHRLPERPGPGPVLRRAQAAGVRRRSVRLHEPADSARSEPGRRGRRPGSRPRALGDIH